MSTSTSQKSREKALPLTPDVQPFLHDLTEEAWENVELILTRAIETALRRVFEEHKLAACPAPYPVSSPVPPSTPQLAPEVKREVEKTHEPVKVEPKEEKQEEKPVKPLRQRVQWNRLQVEDKDGNWQFVD